MDFCQLLHTAQKNDKNGANGARYYSTKFEPPKKVKKESKDLSQNIKKFLAKKEAEEQKKRDEDQKKKVELLTLRAQDKKATRRVNVMLKRTKSANQSVIEDAKDDIHTAVTRAGPDQPDEDDYGYVSTEASQYYEKMMEKYSKMPEEPKFNLFKKKVSTNLSSTKDRVKAALEKEREEAMGPHRRKRKKKEGEGEDKNSDKAEDKSPEYNDTVKDTPKDKPKPKPKIAAPPPMSFTELLKIAEKKQFEPIVIEQKPQEEEKLLTKKQKKEAEKEREWREKREARRLDLESSSSSRERQEDKNDAEPRSKDRDSDRDKSAKKVPKAAFKQASNNAGDSRILEKHLTKPNLTSGNDRPPIKQNKASDSFKKPYSVDSRPIKSSGPSKSEELRPFKSKDSLPHNGNLKNSLPNKASVLSSKNTSTVAKPNLGKSDGAIKKGAPSMASGGRPKEFPPRDLLPKSKAKEFPPRDLKPKQSPPPDVRGLKRKQPMVANRGRIIDDDSEEEYDSELDDFIDDDPEEGENYSSYIKEIFGYDKSRYRGLDEDDDNMETSFAQQMKEEVISTKIGIREDLEDMKKEEEEKRLKALKMKKMRR